MIEKPRKAPANKAMRSIAKAAAGAVPVVGSSLSEIADALVPDHEARDRERWEGDVTEDINDLHGRVGILDAQTGVVEVRFSGPTAAIATYMIERCPDGLARDDVSRDDLAAQFPGLSRDEMLDALGELESYGLIRSMEFMNDEALYCLSEYAYEVLDLPIMGWDTHADARRVAALAVENRDYVLTHDLEKKLEWPRRRFNPAHRILVQMIDPAHVSDEIQPQYVTLQFNPSNGEHAQLRRFAAGL